ncbi:MAG: exosortase/archaeosortase family protein [Actinomycetota bacterium]|nr:exosortase/archaeosortase family protein [Actinomycetota bacterium]
MSSPQPFTADSVLKHGRSLPPLTYQLPAWEPTSQLRPRSRTQFMAGLAMFAAALWLAFEDAKFRHFEARIATPVTALITGRKGAVTSRDTVYFALGTRRAFGLIITNECTSALLLIPLLVMMGAFTMFSRLPLRRQLVALAVGAGLMMLVNVLRVCGICWSTWRFGINPGYKYSHVFVGSAMSLIGFVGAMLAALWVLVRTERMRQVVSISRAWWVSKAPASHRRPGHHPAPPIVVASVSGANDRTRPMHRHGRRRASRH